MLNQYLTEKQHCKRQLVYIKSGRKVHVSLGTLKIRVRVAKWLKGLQHDRWVVSLSSAIGTMGCKFEHCW